MAPAPPALVQGWTAEDTGPRADSTTQSDQADHSDEVDNSDQVDSSPSTPGADQDSQSGAADSGPAALPSGVPLPDAQPNPDPSDFPRSAADELFGDIVRITPDWLRRLPAEYAVLGVLGLGVAFGIASAALRRSRDGLE